MNFMLAPPGANAAGRSKDCGPSAGIGAVREKSGSDNITAILHIKTIKSIFLAPFNLFKDLRRKNYI